MTVRSNSHPMATPSLEPRSPHVDETPLNGVELFVLEGEFDAASAPKFEEQLETAIAAGRFDVCVDMSGVTFVDLSTLNVLVRALKRVMRHNGHLVLVGDEGAVQRAISLASLGHCLRVFPTRDEAVNVLHGGPTHVSPEQVEEVRRRMPKLRRRTRPGR